MHALVIVLVVLGFVALSAWSLWWQAQVVAELATRSEKEFQVAGLDKMTALKRQSMIGIGPWRMHRMRKRLDRAAADIARFEAGQQ